MSDKKNNVIRVTINGKSMSFDRQITILEALRAVGISIPSLCCHARLSSTHHCGLCLVAVKFPDQKDWSIVPACMMNISEGTLIDTKNEQAIELRNAVMSLYLLKHSMDCSLCDKVEDCFFHKFAINNNFRGQTRLQGTKYVDRKLKRLGDRISIDNMQCISCGRCLTFCNEILGEDILGNIRNEQNIPEVSTYPGKEFNNNYSLNLVDLCPVGAIVDNSQKDFDHQIWKLRRTPSISPESSVGINTYVLHNKKHVFRIIPRDNERINQSWMTDSARELYKIQEPANRVIYAQQSGKPAEIRRTLAYASGTFLQNNSGTFIVFSGEMSLEDQFALKRFMDVMVAAPYFVRRTTEGDGFLMSDDPYPNTAGAALLRLSNKENTHPDLKDLYGFVAEGRCTTIISVYEDLFADEPPDGLFDNTKIIYVGYRANRTSDRADFVFPVATIFERTGTFINKDMILQKFYKAVETPRKVILDCWAILALFMHMCYQGDREGEYTQIEQIWNDLSHAVLELEELSLIHILTLPTNREV